MEPSPRFSPNIELVLRDAGWFPGRIVSEDRIDSWLLIEWRPSNSCPQGYSKIHPTAWRVLREFGDLEIRPFRVSTGGAAERFTLNPTLVAEEVESHYTWHSCEWLTGETLFPLGIWHGYVESPLAISTHGQIFLLYRFVHSIYLLGNTIEEALETLISGVLPDELDVSKNIESSHIVKKLINRIEERELMKGEWG